MLNVQHILIFLVKWQSLVALANIAAAKEELRQSSIGINSVCIGGFGQLDVIPVFVKAKSTARYLWSTLAVCLVHQLCC